MSTIKSTSAYWKHFLLDTIAKVKQLVLPTFFKTLSCADLHWNELISIIAKLNRANLLKEYINNMDFFQRWIYLSMNPVLLARHSQHRVEIPFKVIVVDGPLGRVKYHTVRVESQVRGNPRIYSLLWKLDAPGLCNTNIEI